MRQRWRSLCFLPEEVRKKNDTPRFEKIIQNGFLRKERKEAEMKEHTGKERPVLGCL
ncbi:MAG: hypothetical protein Q8P67_04990 [archaeon]|nr:hypothetical protein [archaeon]